MNEVTARHSRFIWWNSTPELLSGDVLKLLEDEANTPVISVVNIWEIQIKAAVGKIVLNLPLEEIVDYVHCLTRNTFAGTTVFAAAFSTIMNTARNLRPREFIHF
ncbi:MAG: hypothetical protein LCI00_11640 [Chloroflexi bacterium]|nr:hypothetical protein [Chloroflexota bacterium]MCC6896339.1 hypothetical protein [Anaerolineae bacterium]